LLQRNNRAGEGRVPKVLILGAEDERNMKMGSTIDSIGPRSVQRCTRLARAGRCRPGVLSGVLGLPAHRGVDALARAGMVEEQQFLDRPGIGLPILDQLQVEFRRAVRLGDTP
jgi:hypothetical protein